MANLLYPTYIQKLAIYSVTLNPEIGLHDEVTKDVVCALLQWDGDEGYSNALDQIHAVQACARILGHDEKNIGLAALINGKWIAIDEANLKYGV